MKIQAKTTLLFTILTATIFLILNIVVYIFISSFANNDFHKRLELRARISSKYRFEHGEVSTEAFREIEKQYLERLPEEQAFILKLDTLSGPGKRPLPKPLTEKYITEITEADGNTVFDQVRFRHFAGFLYKDESGKYIVIKSATNEYGTEMMRHLAIIKFVNLIFAVALIYTVGRYFSKKTFKPFRDIINRVKQINEGNLHLRLKEQEGADEIAELTSTFNLMLNRLETAFEIQNNFVSNASHELRTPLTAIVAEADLALSKERTVEGYQQSLLQITKQAEKLQELTRGLLSLAQTGFDGKRQRWETIRLDQLLFDVKENCDAIVPDNKIGIRIDEMPEEESSSRVQGNYNLLVMAISNIVMNACKYSDNNKVSIHLYFRGKNAEIWVVDKGIGIPADEMKYIYNPFFRASNTTRYEGYGIGMPLSNNIIRLHKGVIEVKSTVNEGTTVKIGLPLVDNLTKE